ncbi:MAG: hypothetical protein HZA94_02025 [Candidatus Vogelbacteria bacterium]|nr:hypothetical protein [Candidatus Vogelbacteria bacterium]
MPASSVLSLEDGAVVKAGLTGNAGSLSISGRLETNGLTSSGVIFTSTSAEGAKGAWNGITMNSGSSSHLAGLTINGAKTGIKYTNSKISLDNVLFSNNTTAVQVVGNSTVETALNVTFTNNTTNTNPSGLW